MCTLLFSVSSLCSFSTGGPVQHRFDSISEHFWDRTLLTRLGAGVGRALRCRPPKKLSPASPATAVVDGLNREDVSVGKIQIKQCMC